MLRDASVSSNVVAKAGHPLALGASIFVFCFNVNMTRRDFRASSNCLCDVSNVLVPGAMTQIHLNVPCIFLTDCTRLENRFSDAMIVRSELLLGLKRIIFNDYFFCLKSIGNFQRFFESSLQQTVCNLNNQNLLTDGRGIEYFLRTFFFRIFFFSELTEIRVSKDHNFCE